ncbi:terpenoid cyclases/Protein prenyltransferase [Pleurotus eryngii]|uniref:Protein farnesyltransferase subunit beta n=1 Tax=Pleurotus eryngii TaxID=5323 RepID=A0A9P5ZII7_PLEER|nr:terpenoid cyclases/Protein prenyltransferase [Pleurotus eryngii]
MANSRSPRPAPDDAFPTSTSRLQAETEAVLLDHIPTQAQAESAQLPAKLNRSAHVQFLARNFIQGFPAKYTSQDASQPWLMFWTLQSFSVLQVGLDAGNKQRAIDTILTWQHPDGGFGGGPGQAAHLLASYASVCALSIAGGPGEKGGWDQIDRKKMYQFFMSLKQPDGSFLVAHHAEVDVRGIYCLLVTATLLDIITPELIEGTASFIASCQTYEGGFSSASQPYYSSMPYTPESLLSSPRPPLGEAHGGYTFCALASWVMLQPFLDLSPGGISRERPQINVKSLVRWLVQMQGSAAEIGGFRGRTNKLVDGCYSWWVGGAFSLLEALGVSASATGEDSRASGRDAQPGEEGKDGENEHEWDDVDDSFFHREALQEYVLYAGQHPTGGLRDKPPKNADAYHTMYCLSGLSSAQHRMFPSVERREQIREAWKAISPQDTLPSKIRKETFLNSLSWTEDESASKILGGEANRVNATHPVFNLTITHSESIMSHFYGQKVPSRARSSP